jgi:predicted metal-binding membrane protein
MRAADARLARAGMAMRWHPEWRITVLVAVAWFALLSTSVSHGGHVRPSADRATAAEQSAETDHRFHKHRPSEAGSPEPSAGWNGSLRALSAWTLMALAMMVPVTLPAIRHVGLNSIRRRRQWAMSLYLIVYLGVWMVFGLLALGAYGLLEKSTTLGDRALLAFALVVAAGWQLTRYKRRAVFACRRTVPLPPTGFRADVGCARFALKQALRCVTSCWALMGAMVVGHGSLVWMGAFFALILTEELTLIGRRLLRPAAVALAAAAGVVAVGF